MRFPPATFCLASAPRRAAIPVVRFSAQRNCRAKQYWEATACIRLQPADSNGSNVASPRLRSPQPRAKEILRRKEMRIPRARNAVLFWKTSLNASPAPADVEQFMIRAHATGLAGGE